MNDLKFTATHEWLRKDSIDEVTVGITDHAQQLLGDMVYVELPQIGEVLSAGEELGVVESVKAASDFYTPVSGVVIAVNTEIVENPALVNKDPYHSGWLVKLRPTHSEEFDELLDDAQYQNELAKED